LKPKDAWKMDATDQPLWLIERFWPVVGRWETAELQTMEVVGKRLVRMRPKHQTATYARLVAILNMARKLWPQTVRKADFRLRNTRTGDVVMGAIL
jgi:hypothetical protein